MVVIIKTGHSIQRILNYNENKIKEGQAIIISASNYPMDLNQLSFKNKLNRLINQASLNEDVSRNSVHISLNFGPAENLSKDSLSEIAETYMNRIGFGEQPFLVYQHFDAGHPHVHIVSIKVRSDGSRIDTHNIGRNQSEKARKEIENLFGLKKAEDSKNNLSYELKPVSVQKVQYGKTASKRAISVILDRIIDQYKFCSIAELNAVLRQYNVIADQGSEASRIYKNNGLVYRILDSQGNKTGVPIKASDFYNKPTLKRLQERFLINEISKQPHKARIKNAIDLIFLGEHPSLQQMITILEKRVFQQY